VLSLREERQRNLWPGLTDPVKMELLCVEWKKRSSVNAQFVNFLFSIAYTLTLRFFRSFCFDQVKRRLVDVAILACGDVFPNLAAFQRSYFEGATAFAIIFLFFIYCF
jgi:hypothetical protein